MNGWKTTRKFSNDIMLNDDKNFLRKLWKKLSRMRKSGFRKNLPALPPREFSHVALLVSNHTAFLVQFEIYLHLWVFRELKSHSPKTLVQINFKLYEKNRIMMITYTNIDVIVPVHLVSFHNYNYCIKCSSLKQAY